MTDSTQTAKTIFGKALEIPSAEERAKYLDQACFGNKPLRIAVQGFGNVGYHFARLAAESGHKIVAVSDSKGAIFKEAGLDPVSVNQVKQESRELKAAYCKGSVCEIVEHEKISNEELLELDVDVLVPASEPITCARSLREIACLSRFLRYGYATATQSSRALAARSRSAQ